MYYLCSKKNKTIMWDLFKILIGIFLLILIIPLLWLLIHVILLFFGWVFGALAFTGIAVGDIFGWLFIIGLIIFIVWCICS